MMYESVAKYMMVVGGAGALWLGYTVVVENARQAGYDQAIEEADESYKKAIAVQTQEYHRKLSDAVNENNHISKKAMKRNNLEWQRRYDNLNVDLIKAQDLARKAGVMKSEATNLDRSFSRDAFRLLEQATSIVSAPTGLTSAPSGIGETD
ncbi:MAG: hypothetical protein GY829_14885 [Gammaproteobacteria bacterium]|nr:hypothetical protein [Gammaproteobacteria bacterium]